MAGDVPNAFIQAEMIMEDGKERIIMKIMGPLVDVLLEIKRDMYQNYVVYERGEKVIYVVVLRAIHGMLEAALTWYKKFKERFGKYLIHIQSIRSVCGEQNGDTVNNTQYYFTWMTF